MKRKEVNTDLQAKMVKLITDVEKEDMALLMMIKEVDRTEKVTREEVMKILVKK